MLKKHRDLRNKIQWFIDGGMFSLAFFVAYFIRSNLPPWVPVHLLGGTSEISPFTDYLLPFIVVMPLSILVLATVGFYNRPLLSGRKMTTLLALKACLITPLCLIITMFLSRGSTDNMARAVPLIFGFVSFTFLLGKEEVVSHVLRHSISKGRFRKRIIVVGSGSSINEFKNHLASRGHSEFEISGVFDPTLESLDNLPQAIHHHSTNAVVISAKNILFSDVEKIVHFCELEGVEVWLLADFIKTNISRTSVDDLYGQPTLVFRSAPDLNWQSIAKRALDFSGALILLILLAFPLAIVTFLIRVTSPGPIFFHQMRSGLNGKPFRMYKFRSMVTNAEQKKHELAQFNEMSGPVFKISNDPRVTPFGRFIRKYSIDELPQLYNVLRGEMSLVGPRPLPVDETLAFDDYSHRRRLSVKPGLTCLWQISGRSNLTDFSEWVRLDLEYIDNWNFWLDLKILIYTIPVVLAGAGAK
ncbi:MAG: sugar transferase [Verrucomicrobia bacterium]|nr:sugar transferase [Verrucomicrobiota bacterium]